MTGIFLTGSVTALAADSSEEGETEIYEEDTIQVEETESYEEDPVQTEGDAARPRHRTALNLCI